MRISGEEKHPPSPSKRVSTQAVFYRDEKGREPVRCFLRGQTTENSRLLIEEQIDELNGLPDNAPLHIFRKDSRAVSKRDIDLAQRRWSLFKQEMDNPDRRGPRPAGQDAP